LINEISKTLPRGHWSTVPLLEEVQEVGMMGGWEFINFTVSVGVSLSLFFSRNKELPSIDCEV